MKNYRMTSKVVVGLCLCLIVLAIINGFTGFINSTIQASGTIICITGFVIAIVATVLSENNRAKRIQTKTQLPVC
jgi:hypothetical protein